MSMVTPDAVRQARRVEDESVRDVHHRRRAGIGRDGAERDRRLAAAAARQAPRPRRATAAPRSIGDRRRRRHRVNRREQDAEAAAPRRRVRPPPRRRHRRGRRERSTGARPSSEPSAVTAIVSVSETVRSPPSTAQPGASASHAARRPSASRSTNDSARLVRHRQRDQQRGRPGTHRRDVGEVDGRRLPAEVESARPREPEVRAVHEGVGRRDDAPIRGGEHGRVVARSDQRAPSRRAARGSAAGSRPPTAPPQSGSCGQASVTPPR